MNPPNDNTPRRGGVYRYVAIIGILIAIVGATLLLMRRQPRAVKVLNEPTKAREVRPLTTEKDPRFAPLPLEREKHGK